jgi:hypothetical protein
MRPVQGINRKRLRDTRLNKLYRSVDVIIDYLLM